MRQPRNISTRTPAMPLPVEGRLERAEDERGSRARGSHEVCHREGSLLEVRAELESLGRSGRVDIFLVEVSERANRYASALKQLQEQICSLEHSVSCPQLEEQGRVTQRLNGFLRAVNLLEDSQNRIVFLSGAAEALQSELLPRIKARAKESLAHALTQGGGKILTIPYSRFDKLPAANIMKFISELRHSNFVDARNIFVTEWILKSDVVGPYDFSELPKEVSRQAHEIAKETADFVFSLVWQFTESKLDDDLKQAMARIEEGKKEHIRGLLVRGICEGGGRPNDRPWDLHKVAEESRKQLLAALIPLTGPTYSARTCKDPKAFYEVHVAPKLEKFSLPASYIDEVAPGLRMAIRRQ